MLQPETYIRTTDYLVSKESFDLRYNDERDMLITTPQPTLENLSLYYESDAYISHTDDKKGLLSFLYQTIKKRSIKKKLKLLKSQHETLGSLLDIGAGTADFLVEAKNAGWEIQGVEPNEDARNLASQKGISLQDSLSKFDGQEFDVITLWHVLEHLPNLENSIKDIESLLKRNGTLIVAVPNFKSYDAIHYKEHWAAYDAPRHLWHFSRASMKRIFSERIKLEKTKPMIFDSFYVSLLSEKYKTGAGFSLKAFLIGFISNISAIRSKEYSSLIYCYRKQ